MAISDGMICVTVDSHRQVTSVRVWVPIMGERALLDPSWRKIEEAALQPAMVTLLHALLSEAQAQMSETAFDWQEPVDNRSPEREDDDEQL